MCAVQDDSSFSVITESFKLCIMLTILLYQVADFDDLEEDKFLNAVVKVAFKNALLSLLIYLFPHHIIFNLLARYIHLRAASAIHYKCCFGIVCQTWCSNMLHDLLLNVILLYFKIGYCSTSEIFTLASGLLHSYRTWLWSSLAKAKATF